MSINNAAFYPNVTRMPSANEVGDSKRPAAEGLIKKGEFDQSLDQAMKSSGPTVAPMPSQGLDQASAGLKFSAHAMQRLRERQIQFSPEMMVKMNDAITKADSKGVQDTLMLTDKAALIVSVPNRTVITAMDRSNLSGNVFTNIDGAIII